MRTATTILAMCVAALLVLGSVILYSAVSHNGARLYQSQMMYMAMGLVLCFVLAFMDYRKWKTWVAWCAYGLAIALLIGVFVPGFGVGRNGAHRWVHFGRFQLQASEIAKLALILALAAFAERHRRKMSTFKHGILLSGLIVAPVLLLILVEIDVGTTLTLGAVVAIMLFVSGVRWAHVLPVACAALIGVGGFVASNPNRMQRIEAMFHRDQQGEDKSGQSDLSVEAVSYGSLWGTGLNNSPFVKGANRVPLYFSDFIFIVIASEGGLAATMGTVLLYLTFLFCGVYIAWHARDLFGMLVATGLTFFICLQAFIHMGVATGILPNKGFPLPFISHGGTNLMFNLAAVGLLFSVARRAVARVKSNNPFESHVGVPIGEAA